MTKFELLMNMAALCEETKPEDFIFGLVDYVYELLEEKDQHIGMLEEYVEFLEDQVDLEEEEEEEEVYKCHDLDELLMSTIFEKLRLENEMAEQKEILEEKRAEVLKAIFSDLEF